MTTASASYDQLLDRDLPLAMQTTVRYSYWVRRRCCPGSFTGPQTGDSL